MADITFLGPDCDDDGERGERGKRGHRGHAGPTGPTGPTGSGTLLHTEDTALAPLVLANNASTEVLSAPAITPGLGSQVQITGVIGIQLIGRTFNFSIAIVSLREDGVVIATFTVSLAATDFDADLVFDSYGAPSVVWTFVADGLPHVYSINIDTDVAINGAWSAMNRAMFVNVLPPP